MGSAWTIKAMLDWISGYLGDKGDENPLFSAQAMVSHVTGLQKIQLYMNHDRQLDDGQLARLRAMVKRRAAGEPLQYLLGTAPFRYLDIKVRPGVLIPRPETEVLVSELLAQLPSAQRRVAADSLLNEYEGAAAIEAQREGTAAMGVTQQDAVRQNSARVEVAARIDDDEFADGDDEPFAGEFETFGMACVDEEDDADFQDECVQEGASTNAGAHDAACDNGLPDNLLIADLCTGTGCIACALATERDDVRVIATDLSPEAVSLAKENVVACGAKERIGVLLGDLGEPVEKARPQFMGTFDAVISNPPYIPTDVLATLPREVADFEPELALDGGEDGLDLFRRILDWSQRALREGGVLAVELHETCLDEAATLAREAGFKNVRIALDLASRPRVLTACK